MRHASLLEGFVVASRLLKNTVLAFFNPRHERRSAAVASKITTYVVILVNASCVEADCRILQQSACVHYRSPTRLRTIHSLTNRARNNSNKGQEFHSGTAGSASKGICRPAGKSK